MSDTRSKFNATVGDVQSEVNNLVGETFVDMYIRSDSAIVGMSSGKRIIISMTGRYSITAGVFTPDADKVEEWLAHLVGMGFTRMESDCPLTGLPLTGFQWGKAHGDDECPSDDEHEGLVAAACLEFGIEYMLLARSGWMTSVIDIRQRDQGSMPTVH